MRDNYRIFTEPYESLRELCVKYNRMEFLEEKPVLESNEVRDRIFTAITNAVFELRQIEDFLKDDEKFKDMMIALRELEDFYHKLYLTKFQITKK